VKPEIIRIIPGDTHLTKNSGSTSATRQTFFTGNAVKEASEGLLSNIYHYASIEFRSNAEKVKESGDSLKAEASFFPHTDKPDPKTGQGEKVYVAYTFVTLK